MQELEKLLNTLIKMGWKPRYKNKVAIISIRADELRLLEESWSIYTPYSPRLRELVSLESWLWQFCSDNELTKSKTSEYMINRYIKELITREEWDVIDADVLCSDLYHEYRLLESALVPEEELGQFLIDNIKIE